MAKTVCKVLGLVLLLLGVAGFASPTLLGLNLNPAHNAVHIVAGVLALYFGFAGSWSGAKGFCLVLGVIHLGLGLCGVVLGDSANNRLWHVGPLNLTVTDHGLNFLLAAAFLAGGLFTKKT